MGEGFWTDSTIYILMQGVPMKTSCLGGRDIYYVKYYGRGGGKWNEGKKGIIKS